MEIQLWEFMQIERMIPVENCLIQDKESTKIAKSILDLIKEYNISAYNEETLSGIIRHIIIKKAFKTGEIMIIIVINDNNLPKLKEISDSIFSNYPNVKSIIINSNMKKTNVILGDKNVKTIGESYITDILGDFKFKISSHSFYQVNPVQAEAMYYYAVEEANISKEDIVFDLYCGIGTISLFLSKFAKKVYGVEIVEQAVEMADENAQLNNIDNTEFIAGDTEYVLSDLLNNKKIIPDIIVVDPPRKGLDNTTIANILKIKPKKVIYISCNPASLTRDLSKLEDLYNVKSIQPFDMFPFTSHTETISVLKLKNK